MGNISISRRQFLALSAAVSASALVACAAPVPAAPQAGTGAAAPAAERVTVSHWIYSTLTLDKTTLKAVPVETTENVTTYFDWNADSFRDQNPNIDLRLEMLPHDQSWFAKLDASLIAGAPPDVVQGPVSEAAKYVPLGALSALDDYIDPEIVADLHPAVAAETSFDGRQYVWPWRLSFGGGIAINATIWEQNGVADLLPSGTDRRWEMDTFLETAKANTTDGVYGTVWSTDIHYQITQFMYGFGARLFNEEETEVILNSPEGVEGLQWLVDAERVHNVAVPGGAIRKAQEAGQLFTEGRAATFPSQGSGKTPPQFEDREDFKWYWAPPPNVPGKEPAVMTNIHGHYVFQQKNTAQTEAAHLWAQYLVRPDSLKVSLDEFGMPPALQSLWPTIVDENMKVGLQFTNIMSTFGRRASAAAITFSLAPRMLEAALSGQLSPQAALDEFAAEGNKLIQEAMEG